MVKKTVRVINLKVYNTTDCVTVTQKTKQTSWWAY